MKPLKFINLSLLFFEKVVSIPRIIIIIIIWECYIPSFIIIIYLEEVIYDFVFLRWSYIASMIFRLGPFKNPRKGEVVFKVEQ